MSKQEAFEVLQRLHDKVVLGAYVMHADERTAVRVALDFLKADGWQPIETAPKDGTVVLLYWRAEHGPDTVDYFASGEYTRFGDGSGGWCGESFHASVDGYWTRLLAERPTHWMPLPPPPDEVPS